ncbi:MAG: hypothetical protein C7K11_05110 [Candidatus Amulumruptor caecigallinarius]|nr:MAG: hypothetical protein C7K11_05110 [Candidatus Amulumruptor caecigallinarius]
MIYFSLKRILDHAPYDLLLSGSDFMFQTDLGIHYIVSFSKEDIVLGGCDTYQLIIRKIEEARSPHDSKVEATILAIIKEFFQSNFEVLLYLCDTSDGREAPRNRLFITWFDRYIDKDSFTIREAHAQVEGEGLFICIVVDKRNPKLKAIIDDFDEKAAMLTAGKPE